MLEWIIGLWVVVALVTTYDLLFGEEEDHEKDSRR
jgi:hypothetical protein